LRTSRPGIYREEKQNKGEGTKRGREQKGEGDKKGKGTKRGRGQKGEGVVKVY
jgi:hypothetical protein